MSLVKAIIELRTALRHAFIEPDQVTVKIVLPSKRHKDAFLRAVGTSRDFFPCVQATESDIASVCGIPVLVEILDRRVADRRKP